MFYQAHHMFFFLVHVLTPAVQYHPQHVQWGNISWGHATSKDMVTWTDAPAANVPNAVESRPLAFVPSSSINVSKDRLGVVRVLDGLVD
jgi:sucrose-6-phosphate hydrolase SacC (GH32 family)